ncbi:hypothetical protein Mal15_19580 [Stieleria maiorica]|uniref:Uncharacterized protein n=1 Tax=Stieleria maiorica TaxID=2795974 RepID=A0A5B9M9N9_9BACT|nr:hypothetical protein [Stieleria maiorica]QEF97912.1 hypothetical protein Mal15_19580 [Stieleria maiorica]
MKTAAHALFLTLLTVSVGSAQNPWGDWIPQQSRSLPTGMSYQQRAGSTTTHRNGATSKTWGNSGLRQESQLDIGFSAGNDKDNAMKFGRQRDEKWFAGVRGGVRAGYAADTGISQEGRVGNTKVRTYSEAEAFVGVEAGAQAGVSNNGVGINGNAFAGARVRGSVGTDVGPVGVAATGEAWSGVGVEAGVDAKYKNGRVNFDYGVGGAVGVGGKAGGEVSVDLRKPAKAVNRVRSTGRKVSSTSKRVKSKGKAAKNNIKKLFK